MRIVFVNLHANEMLLKTLPKYVFKQSCAIKHGYLLRYLLENPEYEVCSYVNNRAFSLMHNGPELVLDFLNLFRFWEHRSVLKKNGIDPKKITVLKKLTDIRKDDMVVFYRLYSEQMKDLSSVDAFRVVSMIHFGGDQKEAEIIKEAAPECMMNESQLALTSELYRHFYHYDGPWIVHPFVFEPRFQVKKPFAERKNMAFSTGTITYKTNPEFLEVYGDPCDQPSRKQIKDNPEYLAGCVDCYSSDYMEDADLLKTSDKDNALVAFGKKLYNRFHTGQQKKYYSFNMVDKFNEYKMCIVGEEILGVPGIGFVEGMACGSAYIGLDSPMYTDLGLYPGIHYIGYDGTLKDLKEKIQYYQAPEHQEELERIAATGCAYVREHFSGNAAAESLLNRLKEQQAQWKARKEEA